MTDIELEIATLRKQLESLRRQRQKSLKPPKPKSDRGRGRPTVEIKKIRIARELAKDFSLADVALSIGVSRSTLYRKNIKRYVLDMQAARKNLR